MNSFRTALTIPEIDLTFSHHHHILCMGSCFAEHMGERLRQLKFPLLLNPFGILYNPASIAKGIERLLADRPYQLSDLFEHQGLWHSFDHHGRFSHPDRSVALSNINASWQQARDFLDKTDRLILTLGTAYIFEQKLNGEVVANCHKLPGQVFEQRRLGVSEIVEILTTSFGRLLSHLPNLGILVTVSPVRHIRNGLIENQRSKAALLLALEEVCRTVPAVHYFPSYEIMLDDLRDYRFYEADMIHPNSTAIDYIWQTFEQACLPEETRQLCKQVRQFIQASGHRPFHPGTEAHQKFLRNQLNLVETMERNYPLLSFEEEKRSFSSQLITP